MKTPGNFRGKFFLFPFPLSLVSVACCLALFCMDILAMWLPRWLSGKESSCPRRRRGFNPWFGKFLGEGNSNPLQNSCLGNPMDRGAWWATVHGGHKRVGHDLEPKTTTIQHYTEELQSFTPFPSMLSLRVL